MKTALLVLTIAGTLSAQVGPAPATPPGESDPPGLCLADLVVHHVTMSPDTIRFGEPVTVSWHVSVPGPCPGLSFTLNGPRIFDPGTGSVGSRLLFPETNEPYILEAHMGGRSRTLGTVAAAVSHVPLPVVDGRFNVEINSNDQTALFVQALTTPGAIIRIASDVQLDLSFRDNLYVAPGVQVFGRRSSRSRGAKLFTRTFPRQLFQIGLDQPSDNVRFSGLRIEGAEMGIAEESHPSSTAIVVNSSINVEIDNNEIYGWRGSGVEVTDVNPTNTNRLHSGNVRAVHVHDNFIHHNQRYGSLGYGVVVTDAAYAQIERNVFDYNRHAIASSGTPGIGYHAFSNLVLEHGGMNWGPLNFHTHQFDVHGTEECWWAGYYCGPAGESFWFRENTIMYDHGTAIKVRGKPSGSARADFNVFKHPDEWGGYIDDAALVQNGPADTEATRTLVSSNNTFGAEWDDFTAPFTCDFDADGTRDNFIATGATWWYYSNRAASWLHLKNSLKTMSQLTIGDFNGDGYCDVRDNDNGFVHLTPPGPELQGRRLQSPSSPTVFLVLDGKKHPMDAAAQANLFRSPAGIAVVDVSAISWGGWITGSAKLARVEGDSAVWLVFPPDKYWITSPQAMDNFGFDWSKIVTVPASEIASYIRQGDLWVDPAGVTPAVVPDVRGSTVSSAARTLASHGFVRGVVRYYEDRSCNNIGLVISQNPVAGSVVPHGTAVNLSVGTRPRTPCP